MKKITQWVGLDVHAETIAVAVASKDGTVRSIGTIPNRTDAVRRLFKKLGSGGQVQACYEAGPCGYGLYWQLAEMGVECDVVAPTLIPKKSGDRVKTISFELATLRNETSSGIEIGSANFCFSLGFGALTRRWLGEQSTRCGSTV